MKFEMTNVIVICGKENILEIDSNLTDGIELYNNHFVTWKSLRWWERLFLKLCGFKHPTGGIRLSCKNVEK